MLLLLKLLRRVRSPPRGGPQCCGAGHPAGGSAGRVFSSAMFEIDPAFIATSEALGDLALSHVRLQADARFPWIVLIPRRATATELEDLAAGERDVLMEEILRAGAAVRAVSDALSRPATKLNIGQLGNVTPQLHVHVIARRPDDAAWPSPVWGVGKAESYAPAALAVAVAAARATLGL
jgi:diadenosine tetraphosphate (Ap4A) HIT family hydrolase